MFSSSAGGSNESRFSAPAGRLTNPDTPGGTFVSLQRAVRVGMIKDERNNEKSWSVSSFGLFTFINEFNIFTNSP